MTIFQKKQKKLLVIIISMILSFSIFAGLAFIIIPKYLEIKQIERDDTTKCKSYRALEEIAVAMYRNDPEGADWLLKAKEAEIRRKQHKCSQVIFK